MLYAKLMVNYSWYNYLPTLESNDVTIIYMYNIYIYIYTGADTGFCSGGGDRFSDDLDFFVILSLK